MLRLLTAVAVCLLAVELSLVESAKQQVQLSDSYLPVAMQVIAHLTDQMAFEAKDEPSKPAKPQKPPTKPQKPTSQPLKPTSQPLKPTSQPLKPTSQPLKPTSQPLRPTSQPLKPTSQPLKPTSQPLKPTSQPLRPTSQPFKPQTQPQKPNDWTTKPSNQWNKPTTAKPYVAVIGRFPAGISPGSWWMNVGPYARGDQTTPFHRPGLFAPVAPPKPSDRTRGLPKTGFVLLPFDNTQYTVIEPQETRTDEPLLSMHHDEVKPLIEPAKDPQLLPPHFEVDDKANRAEDISDDNLQYLSQNVQEMIKMANDPDDDRIVDVWEGVRGAYNQEVMPKAKLSSSNLRLLLLYDLLSREAKRLRLSDYSGFSPDVMQQLVESSSGGARAQLSMALAKMVERKDCEHEYANNRAKEMVAELAKNESTLSAELRYLQPLVYKL